MSRRVDEAATDLIGRLRLSVIARGLDPEADPVARRHAFAAAGLAIAVLATIRAHLEYPAPATAPFPPEALYWAEDADGDPVLLGGEPQ